jgi:HlyD family secretion protein
MAAFHCRESRMKTLGWRRAAIVALVALLVAGLAWAVLRFGLTSAARVVVVAPERADLEAEVFGIGTVEARRSHAIGPTAAGRVRAVLTDVGEAVRAGDVIAEMDPVDVDDRIAAARAALARARQVIAAADAQGQDATARAQVATTNARRYETLGQQAFFSTSAVEVKQQEAVSARAAVASARANLDAARLDERRLAAELDALQAQRANLVLRAPADAIVLTREVEPGSTVVAGQAVLRLVQPDSLWVRTRIDMARSAGLAQGQQATVMLRSRQASPLAARVQRIEPASDTVMEERIVQVGFDAMPSGVAVGELAEVVIRLQPALGVLSLPNSALVRVGGVEGVWRVEADGKVAFRAVRTGVRALDGRVEIRGGVDDHDRVVTHAERTLKGGDAVRAVETLAGVAK